MFYAWHRTMFHAWVLFLRELRAKKIIRLPGMTFAQHLLSWPITLIAAKQGAPHARWLCNCSRIQLSKDTSPPKKSGKERFLLRQLCVTTSMAGVTFQSTSSGSSPTIAFHAAPVKCIICYTCSSMLTAGTAGIISIPVFSRRYDSFLTPIEIAPFRFSDPTPSSRSDLWYVPTL